MNGTEVKHCSTVLIRSKASRVWAAAAVVALGVGGAAPMAQASTYDEGSISVSLDPPPTGSFYRLRGQSAFIQTRPSSFTSGSQLDGKVNSDVVTFTEVFPEPDLNDYLTYSYIGILELVDFDSFSNEIILDNSLVIGFHPSVVATVTGSTVDDLYGYDEGTLVSQFMNVFDSPEFLDMAFDQVGGKPDTSAVIRLLTQTIDPNLLVQPPPVEVGPGESLILLGFVGGVGGDLASVVGSLEFSMTRVTVIPEPGSAMLLTLAGAALLARRRRVQG